MPGLLPEHFLPVLMSPGPPSSAASWHADPEYAFLALPEDTVLLVRSQVRASFLHCSQQCPLSLMIVAEALLRFWSPCGLSTEEPGPHLDTLLLDPASTDAPSAPPSAAKPLQSPTPPAARGTDPGVCIVGRTTSSGPSTSTSSPCPLLPVAATETWKPLAPPWSTCLWTSAKG